MATCRPACGLFPGRQIQKKGTSSDLSMLNFFLTSLIEMSSLLPWERVSKKPRHIILEVSLQEYEISEFGATHKNMSIIVLIFVL